MGREQKEKIDRLEGEVKKLEDEKEELNDENTLLRKQVKGNLERGMGGLLDQVDGVFKLNNRTKAAADLTETAAERAKLENQAIPIRTFFLVVMAETVSEWAYAVDWASLTIDPLLALWTTPYPKGGVAIVAFASWILFEVMQRNNLPGFPDDQGD